MDKKLLKLYSLEEAKKELLNISKSNKVEAPIWSLYKILVHCNQTIEYSMKGYPKLKPKFIQITVGKMAIKKFLKQRFMKHSLTAPVPDAPVITNEGDAVEAMQKLISSIDKFLGYKSDLYPHLLFGKLTKSNYDKYFAMHIADHLSELNY
ncbi:DUF1569 domain-containing protein [Clostridium estertheticum]|uniref:DUF1569 domain-containing protein n=1 Tax=Clostridium estertheticum TaxID=238834 RepID=UPI001C0B4A0B|nr:DUF1569 domain-containing protein [Clostridium estertheticum]MBU3178325.1 DUF1569 domain-containing protein [Clostridium estertheticum]